jgi:hypothetical protein
MYRFGKKKIILLSILNFIKASAEIAVILSGMQLITDKTGGCITFRAKRRNDLYWIDITKGNGCYSYVIKFKNFVHLYTSF